MPDQATKRRATQIHLDELEKISGPTYGVRLIEDLPIGDGAMRQACPSRADLAVVKQVNNRTAAAYEVLLAHYQRQCAEIERLTEEAERLTGLIRQVIAGDWCVTALQEAIGDV